MIRWTEKIQAIAAIIAILGGIAGFYKLFKTDQETQEQIEHLSTLANQSIEQTDILREELSFMAERNQLLISQLEIDKEQWTKELQPYLSMDFTSWNFRDILDDSFIFGGNVLHNTGGSAIITDITYGKENNAELELSQRFISKNGSILFNLTTKRSDSLKINLHILYKDIEGNQYKQRFISNKVETQSNYEGILDHFEVATEKPEAIFKE